LLKNPMIIEALKDNKNINFDVFRLKKISDNHELSVLSEYMLESQGLFSIVDKEEFRLFAAFI
jgi:hypothetical protein